MITGVEKQLTDRLQPYFEEEGFKAIKHLHQFRRPTRNGFQNVILSVSGRDPVVIEVNIGTRIDLVEKLAYQFTTGLQGYQEDSNTLVTSIGRILDQPYFRFQVSQPEDIQQTADRIIGFMKETGLEFLQQYSKIRELDTLFNDKPRQKLPYAYNHLNRCLRGIVLARLAERKDFPALAATYRATLVKSSTAPPLLERYDKLVSHLKIFSFN